MISLIWSLLVVLLRAVLVARVFTRFGALTWCFGISESLALLSTVYALRVGRRDLSLSGFLVPICHLLPLLFDFSQPGRGPAVGVIVYLMVSPLQWFVRLRLGVRCTVGVPVFVSLCSKFPYSWVRHPLSVLEFLSCSALAVFYASKWNFFVWLLVSVGGLAAVCFEEDFLKRRAPGYLVYCGRVRWRWMPGVW